MTKKKASKKRSSKKAVNKVQSVQVVEEPLLGSVLKTVHGDLVNSMIEELKSHEAENIWNKFGEQKQAAVIDRLNRKAENIIRHIFTLVAQREHKSAVAQVTKVSFEKSVAKISLESIKNEGAHILGDRVNERVMILFVDPEQYLNGKNMPRAERDQKEIPLADNKDNK